MKFSSKFFYTFSLISHLTFTTQTFANGAAAPGVVNPSPVVVEAKPSPTPVPSQPSKYAHLDPKHIVPSVALQKAVDYFDANKAKFPNQKFITVIDFSKHSGKKRFFLINMATGLVEDYVTAHGKGSDLDGDGYANKFSNVSGSEATSLGFYKTSNTYSGNHGYSLLLDGLSSTNSKARERAIVIHKADYVSDSNSKQGRSWGCPALSNSSSKAIIDRIKDGSMIYAWHPDFN